MEQNKSACPGGTSAAKVIQVIQTESMKGDGTAESPYRVQKRLWSLDGKLLAEVFQND